MKNTKRFEIVEFAYGFIVIENGKRIAITATEDDAERVVRDARKAG